MIWVDFHNTDLYVRGYDNKYMKITEDIVDKKEALEIAERLIRTGLEILEEARTLEESK